jgi:hypothetical protein
MSLTLAQSKQARNFKAVAYYNGVFLGMLTEGDHNVRILANDSEFGSSVTGSNGIVGVSRGGEHGEIELTMRNVNLNVIYNVLNGYLTEVNGSTNIDSPYAGNLEGRSNPQVKNDNPLVVYPMFVASDGTEYIDNTSNPLAHCYFRATYSGDFEFTMNADTVSDITLTFKGLVDPDNNNRFYYIGTGVDTDGTIS